MTLLTATALLASAAPAAAADLTIAIPGRSFSPARPTVVTGDTVHWRNADRVIHNITGTGLRSGDLAPGAVFSQRMDTLGAHPFVCTLHPFMSGQVDVVGAMLDAPAGEVLGGSTVELTGRVPAGTGTVAIERVRDGMSEPVATAQANPDGGFKASLAPAETASYRAVARTGVSAPVEVRVVAGIAVRLDVHRSKRFDRVLARARPAPRGDFIAVLQLYSRERFSWRRAGHRALDARGRAMFKLKAGVRRRARIVLLSATGIEVAVSPSVRLWRDGGVKPSKPPRGSRPGSPDEESHHH